jgi:hypothetical protein
MTCPYCGGPTKATCQVVAPGGTQPDGPWEPDGFVCPGCPRLYQGADRQSLYFQRQLVAVLHKDYETNNAICCLDRREPTPRPITQWEMFDRHAVARWCLQERSP